MQRGWEQRRKRSAEENESAPLVWTDLDVRARIQPLEREAPG
jgi:hypothetical protein